MSCLIKNYQLQFARSRGARLTWEMLMSRAMEWSWLKLYLKRSFSDELIILHFIINFLVENLFEINFHSKRPWFYVHMNVCRMSLWPLIYNLIISRREYIENAWKLSPCVGWGHDEYLKRECFTLRIRRARWRSVISFDLRRGLRGRSVTWRRTVTLLRRFDVVFNEINLRFCRLCSLGNWQFNLWLLIGFLHKHINQCFVLVLRLRWNNWSSSFGRFRCLYENYLVMLLRWLRG